MNERPLNKLECYEQPNRYSSMNFFFNDYAFIHVIISYIYHASGGHLKFYWLWVSKLGGSYTAIFRLVELAN